MKKWNPTTRDGCASPEAIAETDSDDVLVASTHSGETIDSTSANTRCLTDSSSKTASITKSASAKPSLDTEPVIRAFCRLAASADSRPRDSSLSISACT